jgi:tetratricopeptide (TPR) repeat protein
VTIPLGADAVSYALGASGAIAAEYVLPPVPLLFLRGELEYDFDFLRAGPTISHLSVAVGGGVRYSLVPWLTLQAFVSGGYYYGFLNGASPPVGGGDPYLSAGAAAVFGLSPAFSIRAGASYNHSFMLAGWIRPFLSASVHLGLPQRAGTGAPGAQTPSGQLAPDLLELRAADLTSVFAVFYKYYEKHPVGRVLIRNKGETPLSDVRMSLGMKDYMDAPKEFAVIPSLKPGEEAAADITALFNQNMLTITESTKVAVEITARYQAGNQRLEQKLVESLRVLDRNAMSWEDDRRPAAFVTAKDPVVLAVTKNVASMVKGTETTAVSGNLKAALALHETLQLAGLAYLPDPKTPYAELSQKKTAVDYLQFPRQTLAYRAGDCDDLSILYAALLESIGVETAFITVPGHIYVAFALDQSPEEARKTYSRVSDLIFKEGKVWVPVEVTEREGGFLKAWELGAQQWREFTSREQADFWPVEQAWSIYEPVGFTEQAAPFALPAAAQVVPAYQAELLRFVDREISPQVTKLQADIRAGGDDPKAINRLGVLYARFGLYDRAEKEFQKALAKTELAAALVNLGNIYFLKEKYEAALDYYERADAREPDNATVLLGLARVNHAMENYGSVTKLYAKLRELKPEIAEQYAYLDMRGDEATRAADVSKVRGVAVWEDE